MHDVFDRLYRTKLLLVCVLLTVVGVVLITIGKQLDRASLSSWSWLKPLPWSELGGILVGAGVLSVWLDHFFRREQAAVDEQHLRRLLHDQAPAMRDAVLDAFAANEADLARVATPETLDQIITNSLALRLHDPQFAGEIYRDIRDQAIAATERWHNASLSIDLSPLPVTALTAAQRRTPYFSVTIRWEYTTLPQHAERRFVCLSDRQEYGELANARGDTSAWYIKPGTSLDISSPDTFELLQFTVNGNERPIRRAVRKHGQIYTASVGANVVAAGEAVTIAYTYRTITAQAAHLLFFDIEQPTRDLRVDLDFTGCGIKSMSALDLIPAVRATRIEQTPTQLPPGTTRIDIDGWVFPRSGVAFVWTLETEVAEGGRRAA